MEKVVLAFSGGLDTTVCVKLLEEEYNYEVVTACVDVGQPAEELQKSQNSADKINTGKHYIIDAKDEFANEYIARGIKANAEYEGYPLSTALARPLIAMKIIEIAEKEGATAIAHGCTGKGNDQFRFEAIIRSMSDFKIIAPIREMNLTRTEEVAYAKEHGLNLSYDKIYSIDENLWGRAIDMIRSTVLMKTFGEELLKGMCLKTLQTSHLKKSMNGPNLLKMLKTPLPK